MDNNSEYNTLDLDESILGQMGGFIKGQKSMVDPKGYRNFQVYTIVGDLSNPLYIDDDPNKGMKKFKGNSPKEVAKKVVTDICQMMKKSDPTGYKKWCRHVTSVDIKKREEELLNIEKIAVKDVAKADSLIDWSKYPGFLFILEDTLNMVSEGVARRYKYYGERIKLDEAKKFKGKKFNYESAVFPIRKDYSLVQALLDHIHKSDKASSIYKRTKNFEKSYKDRKMRAGMPKKAKVKKGDVISDTIDTENIRDTILDLSLIEIKRKCGHKSVTCWNIGELNSILIGLELATTGTKIDKCNRILQWYNENKN